MSCDFYFNVNQSISCYANTHTHIIYIYILSSHQHSSKIYILSYESHTNHHKHNDHTSFNKVSQQVFEIIPQNLTDRYKMI